MPLTGSSAADSGPAAWEFFGSRQMVESLAVMLRLRREALSVGRPDAARLLGLLIAGLEADLNSLSRRTAEVADAAIVRKIRETAKRPRTARAQHLDESVRSIPYPGLGGVKIALIEELDRAVNPYGDYGPYWRAQELGSVEVGNTMTDRVLFGTFTGPGHAEAPRSQYAGAGDASGAQFLMGGGDEPGYGTIGHEDEPRHFLRDGTEEAWAFYRAEVSALSRKYATRITEGAAV